MLNNGRTFTLCPFKNLREYTRLCDILQQCTLKFSKVSIPSMFFTAPRKLEGNQQPEFARQVAFLLRWILIQVLRHDSRSLVQMFRTVVGWTNPVALGILLEVLPKYCATMRDSVTDLFTLQYLPSMEDFFIAPPLPLVVNECTLNNYAMCCITMLNLFIKHKGLLLGPLACIVEDSALHHNYACIGPVLDMVSHILSKKGSEWFLCDRDDSNSNQSQALARAIARNLDVFSTTNRTIRDIWPSIPMHVMLSQKVPELYFNNKEILDTIPCPDMSYIVCANKEQKLSMFRSSSGVERVLFLEKHFLMSSEKFCTSLLDALQDAKTNDMLCDMTAALFTFTSKLDVESWVSVMAPLLMYVTKFNAVVHNKLVCAMANQHMPNLDVTVHPDLKLFDWVVPIFQQRPKEQRSGLAGVIQSKLAVAVVQTQRLTWPYNPKSIRMHVMSGGDIDTVICDQKKWGTNADWQKYAGVYLDCCLLRDRLYEFPASWLTRITDVALLNRVSSENFKEFESVFHKLASRGIVVDNLGHVPLPKLSKMPLCVLRKMTVNATSSLQNLDDYLQITTPRGTFQKLEWVTGLRRFMHIDPKKCQDVLMQSLKNEDNAQVRCAILGALLEDARLGVWDLDSQTVQLTLTPTDRLFLALVYIKDFVRMLSSVFDFDLTPLMPSWIARDDQAFERFLLHASRGPDRRSSRACGPVITPMKLLQCIWAFKYNIGGSHATEAMKTVKRIMTLDHLKDDVPGFGAYFELWRPIYEELEHSLYTFVEVHNAWPVDAATVVFVMDAVKKLSVNHGSHYQAAVRLLKCLSFVRFPNIVC